MSFGAVASFEAKGAMFSTSTSASNLVHEYCTRGCQHRRKSRRGKKTDRIAFVDSRLGDVQPTRTHNLAINDEALKRHSGGTENAAVVLAGSVNGDVGFVALAGCERRELVSFEEGEGGEGRTMEVARDLKPVRLRSGNALDPESVSPSNVLGRDGDVLESPAVLRLVHEAHLDVVEGKLVSVLVIRIILVDIAAIVCGRKG
jgi:hypothetical protein